MKNKSYDQAYLDKLYTRFKNRDEVHRALCGNVGFEQRESADNAPPVIDPNRLAPSGVAENGKTLATADFVKSRFTDRQRFIEHTPPEDNNKTTTFWHITGVTGLGQLLDLPTLFISVSPEEASKENYVTTPYAWQPSTTKRAELKEQITQAVLAAAPRPPALKRPAVAAVVPPAAAGAAAEPADPAAPKAPAADEAKPEPEKPLEEVQQHPTAEQRKEINRQLERQINIIRTTKEGQAELQIRTEHAKRHAVKMFRNIAGKSAGKPIISVLVGKADENKLAIFESCRTDDNFSVPSVSHLLWDNENFPTGNVNGVESRFVEVYDFVHDETHPSLTTQAFDTLYDIYKKTVGNTTAEGTADPNPVVFISKNGLDRGPKFAFAFYLLSKFDEIFLTAEHRPDINKLVLAAFETFRRSHSPVALSNVEDVKQALYIAWGLKIVEMQNDCFQALAKSVNDNRTDPNFRSKAEKINEILAELNDQAKPLAVRFSNIQSKMAQHFSVLSTRHKFTLLDHIPVVPKPVYYNQLKELVRVVNLRIDVEKEILPEHLAGQQAPRDRHDDYHYEPAAGADGDEEEGVLPRVGRR